MARNAIESEYSHFGWPAAILWNFIFKKAIKSDFRSSNMAAGSHFLKKKYKNLRIDLKWREMQSKVIFGHPKWGGGASQWPACKPFGDIHSILPLGKYTNSSF